MSKHDSNDAPLVGTLRFVFALGALIAVGWIGMFLLVRSRW